LENLFSAWSEFSRGKRKKLDVQLFEFALEDNLILLHQQLKNKNYQVSPYKSFYISDPKLRHIHKASVKDRLVFQAVYRVIAPILERQFIYDSYSSRLGKGTHSAVNRLERFLIKTSRNCSRPAYVLKLDIRKFFDSIDHRILATLLCDNVMVRGQDTQWLLKEIIESYWISNQVGNDKTNGAWMHPITVGLPLGNVTSQLFANIYLHQLDFFIKHKLKIKHYIRYCDDFVIIENRRDSFSEYIKVIEQFLNENLKLVLHQRKTIIRKYSQGVDFLGYVLRPHHRTLRTKTKRRLLRKINSKNYFSYCGVLSHCSSYKLKQNLSANG